MATVTVHPQHEQRPSFALAGPLACGCALAGVTGYVAFNDPSNGGAFLPCPFRLLTGWWCPGCGLTRATHHLVRGDITQALRFNLFVVIALLAVGGAWAGWTLAAVDRPTTRLPVLTRRGTQVAGAILAAYGLVRNIPTFEWLRG